MGKYESDENLDSNAQDAALQTIFKKVIDCQKELTSQNEVVQKSEE